MVLNKNEKLEKFCNENFNLNNKQRNIMAYIINYYLQQINNYDLNISKKNTTISEDNTLKVVTSTEFVCLPNEYGTVNNFEVNVNDGIIYITSEDLNVRIMANKNNGILSSANYSDGSKEQIQLINQNDSILPKIYINLSKNDGVENKMNARFESDSVAYKTGKEFISQKYEDKINNIYNTKNYTVPVSYNETKEDLYNYLNSVLEKYNYINEHQSEFTKSKSKKKTK